MTTNFSQTAAYIWSLALISAAVTGKIDVRNWKPPARDAEVG